ncbi:MAG: hypothetical protein H7Y38_16240 [Armatimonadetes bacterium]|nr:hypothetical protein [Armatimonadota bacterium]
MMNEASKSLPDAIPTTDTVDAAKRERDPHCGPVSEVAWSADAEARKRGRVEIFNATRPDGRDKWTMDIRQYDLMREHILCMIDGFAGDDGTIRLSEVVTAAQDQFGTHELFPKGRVRNYCTFTKVDMEARCEIERVPGKSPQRIRRWVND